MVSEFRQCRARSARKPDLQCEIKGPEGSAHIVDHCATEGDGMTFHWTDEFAVYGETANPDRTQVGGDHYRQTSISPWNIIDDWQLDFYRGNALKYLLRAGRKGDAVEDLKKAAHYIEKCIEREQANGGT